MREFYAFFDIKSVREPVCKTHVKTVTGRRRVNGINFVARDVFKAFFRNFVNTTLS
jgi:hypothetical protein